MLRSAKWFYLRAFKPLSGYNFFTCRKKYLLAMQFCFLYIWPIINIYNLEFVCNLYYFYHFMCTCYNYTHTYTYNVMIGMPVRIKHSC